MGRGSADNRYCSVQVRTWDDADVRELSAPPPNARDLWLYLLCGPYTTRIPGVIAGGRAAMAEALGWPQEDFDRCFAEIEQRGMAIADWRARLIYLPNAFRQTPNWPHSPSVCVSWRKVVGDLPECDLLRRIDHDIRMLLIELGDSFSESYESCNRRDKKAASADVATASSASASAESSADSAAVQQEAHSRVRAPEGTGTVLTLLDSSEGKGAGKGLPGSPTAAVKRRVDRWRVDAERVLGALNVARKTVRPSSRGISASYDSLEHISGRLEAGKTVDDCLHVIAVCAAECSRDDDAFQWFDSVSPFRPENFERKSAADPARAAAPRRRATAAQTQRAFNDGIGAQPETKEEEF